MIDIENLRSLLKSEIVDKLTAEIEKIKIEMETQFNWSQIKASMLKRICCQVTINSKTSTGFIGYINNGNNKEYHLSLGFSYHSISEISNLNEVIISIKLNSENIKPDNMIIQPTEIYYSEVKDHDFVFIELGSVYNVTDDLSLKKIEPFIIDFKNQINLGEKVIARSAASQEVELASGLLVGYKDKRYIGDFDCIPGFSGALVSNGSKCVGIITGEVKLGEEFDPKLDTVPNDSSGYGELFIKSLNHERTRKRTYTQISPFCEWMTTIKIINNVSWIKLVFN